MSEECLNTLKNKHFGGKLEHIGKYTGETLEHIRKHTKEKPNTKR